MSIKDKLEIILITYNRKKFLEQTFSQIFAKNSPIKDLNITILDNKSTDGTTEFIDEFIKDYPNVKHIVHNRNIGGNGNIARAFEMATYPYVWVLCDDDGYDWTYWSEVEEGIEKDYDAIITQKLDLKKEVNDGLLLRQLSFLPSAIYKTQNINDNVMQNIVINIAYMFPHLALGCHLINENKKFWIPEHEVIKIKNTTTDYTRGMDLAHPYIATTFWIVGFINSIQLLKDKKKKSFVLNHLSQKSLGFFGEISARFKFNRMYYNNSFRNICDVFMGIDFPQKIQFLFALIWLDIIYFIKKFILHNKKYWRTK